LQHTAILVPAVSESSKASPRKVDANEKISKQSKERQWVTCGNHVMPRFRSGTPDTADTLSVMKKINVYENDR